MNNNSFYASECRKAVAECRKKASQNRHNFHLRACYIELAWANRARAREYALKAA